jgi:thiamine kinase-like enzyme
MDGTRIAERLWPGRVVTVETLGGGITNRNFRVELRDDAPVVVRVGGKDTSLLGIDRAVEHAATRAAAALGLGPEVIDFDEAEGVLVTRFIDGEVAGVEAVRRDLPSVAALVRSFHDAPAIPGRFDAFRVVEEYCSTAAARGVPPPEAYTDAKRTADRIEAIRGPVPVVPCHNDLLNANFLRADGRFWIVDWEYAGMGDRFFDLANFSVNHELDDAGNAELLRAYFGELREDDLRSLRLLRFMSDFREAMWAVVQQAISELDFDFAGYARDHFARLERTAADPAFRDALEASR